MKHLHRRHGVIAMILVLVLALAGCSGGNQGNGDPVATTGSVPAESTAAASETTTAATTEASTEATTEPTTAAKAPEVKYPLTITDDRGNEIVLEKAPERVVPLSGTTLYTFAIAGGKPIAGPTLSKTAPDPGGLEGIERLGHMANIDVEKLIGLNPDFVFIQAMNEKLVPVLQENKIPYYYFGAKSYEEIKAKIREFSMIAGDAQVGEDVVARMEKSIEEIKGQVPAHEEMKIAIVHVTGNGLSLKLSNSIAGDVASMLSLKNITEGLAPEKMGMDAVTFDLEMLVAQDPHAIFITSMVSADQNAEEVLKGHLKDSSAWALLTAVSEDRVFYLPQSHFLFNPVDRYDEAVKIFAKSLWPEAFKE